MYGLLTIYRTLFVLYLTPNLIIELKLFILNIVNSFQIFALNSSRHLNHNNYMIIIQSFYNMVFSWLPFSTARLPWLLQCFSWSQGFGCGGGGCEAAGWVGEGFAHEVCRGFPYYKIKAKIPKQGHILLLQSLQVLRGGFQIVHVSNNPIYTFWSTGGHWF